MIRSLENRVYTLLHGFGHRLVNYARSVYFKASSPEARRRVQELRVYLRAIRSSTRPSTRLLIFAQGRTGTTLLESLLSSTGLFKANGEPLRGSGRHVLDPALYLAGLSRDPARQGDGGHFVCHVKVYHLNDFRSQVGRPPEDPATFIRKLAQADWHIVHVRRKNKVRQVISRYVAEARGNYHKRDEGPETTTIEIDRQEFEARLASRVRYSAEEEAALTGIDYHEVIYERDLLDAADHERTVDEILNYIGLEHQEAVETSLRKINTRPLSEIVENYDEFAEWVRQLGFRSALEPGRENASEA